MGVPRQHPVRLLGALLAVLATLALGLAPTARADGPPAAGGGAPPPDLLEHTPERLATDDAGAAAVTDTPTCPSGPVTADLTLTSDLTCRLRVQGSGITIDLNGRTLFGSIEQYEGRGTTIKNGTIDAASIGDFVGAVRVSGALIDNVTVRNGSAWTMIIGSGTTVQNSRFVDNSSVVFDLYWGGGNVIRRNFFARNGIPMSIQLDNNTVIEENVLIDNGIGVNLYNELGGGVSGNVVARNVFWGNDTGIRMHGQARWIPFGPNMENNQFRDNVFVGNRRVGMLATTTCSTTAPVQCAGANTIIEGNTFAADGHEPVQANIDDGLHIVANPNWSGFFTVRKNIALFNADLGIEAPGVTDGGKNLGLLNGDRRQCVGVRCRPGLFGLF
jgi:hypothetical protein